MALAGIMGGSSSPDMSGQNAAALQQANLSKEQLDWAKQIYQETAPDRAKATQQASDIADASLASMKQNDQISKDYYDYQTGTFRPLEKQIVSDAEAYDTPERRAQAAAQAEADVGTQVDASRAIAARDAASRGVDPSSGNFASTQGAIGVSGAAASAAAANAARTQVETLGAAKKMDAASLGRNLPANQATSAGIALTAGNSSVSQQTQSLAAATSGAGILNAGYNGAQTGLAGAGATYNGITGNQIKINSSNDAMYGALGSMAGAGIAKYSDKNMKKDIEPVNPDEALKAVESTPVSNWAYKTGSKGDDGGQKHTGPMAQDVQKNMGEKAGPKGKMIDLVTLNGMNMAALQGLSKKVDRIAKKVGVAA